MLARNKWVEMEQTVGELRIRLGERARKIHVKHLDRTQVRYALENGRVDTE